MTYGDPKTWPGSRFLVSLLLAIGLSVPTACTAEGPLAQVVFVQGEVSRSRSGGARTPLKAEATLDEQDVLFTGYESFAILHLKNDHLVRIDEDLKLAVKKIALLGADQSSAKPSEQLAALLHPEEQAVLEEALQGTERTAGWHARVMAVESAPAEAFEKRKSLSDFATGAESAPAQAPAAADSAAAPSQGVSLGEEAEADDAVTFDLEEAAPVATPAPSPPPPQATRRAKAMARAPKRPPAKSRSRGVVSEAARAEPAKAKAKKSAPWNVKLLRQNLELKRCLFEGRPEKLKTLRLQLKVKGGVIQRLRLGKASPAPTCARDLLLGKAWGGTRTPGWVTVRLQRP